MKDNTKVKDQISFVLNGKPLVPSHQPLNKEQVNENHEIKREVPSESSSETSQGNK